MLKGKVDVIFLSPPWGGPAYLDAPVFDIGSMMVGDDQWAGGGGSVDGNDLFDMCRAVTPNVAYYLPRNTSSEQLAALQERGCSANQQQDKEPMPEAGGALQQPRYPCELEELVLNRKVKAVCAYYGEFLVGTGNAEASVMAAASEEQRRQNNGEIATYEGTHTRFVDS